MVLRSFMIDVIEYLENHDMEKWAWDVEDLCKRIDRLKFLYEKWKHTKSDKIAHELILALEDLLNVW